MLILRNCRHCGEQKLISDFLPRSNSRDGYGPRCLDCVAPRTRYGHDTKQQCASYYMQNRERLKAKRLAAYYANPQLHRDRMLQRNYGITLTDYDRMLREQGGVCAICGRKHSRESRDHSLHVDHCHDTGRVRGILCSDCNKGVGMFNDSPKRLRRAAAYLEGRLTDTDSTTVTEPPLFLTATANAKEHQMNINTAFKSKFLKGAEIEGDTVFTISGLEQENVGGADKEEVKPVLYFEETDKGLVLNRTNSNTIQGLYGPETDDWVGKKITLFGTEVDFQGKQTLAIRVRMKKPSALSSATKPTSSSAAAAGTSPRAKAWKAFCDATPNTEMDPRRQAWADAVAEVFPGRDEKSLGGADWAAFAQKIEAEYTEGDGFLPI